MDYKTFFDLYINSYYNFTDYIDSTINKNVLKGDEIVNEYITQISEQNYSLKSYKAKIIRNEQEQIQNISEIEKERNTELDNLNNIINDYLSYYLNNDIKNSQEDKSVIESLLKELTNNQTSLNKQINETNNKITNLTLKMNKSLDEDHTFIKNKIKELYITLNDDLLEINNKVNVDIYSDENNLLKTNTIKEIKEIKKQIATKREKGILSAYNLKLEHYKKIYELNKDYINKSEEYKYQTSEEINKLSKEIIDAQKELSLLENKIKENSESIVLDEKRKNAIEYNETFNKLVDMIKNHNDFMNQSFDSYSLIQKDYLNKILIINYTYLLYTFYKNNEHNNLISFIKDIIREINESSNKYIDIYNELGYKCVMNKQKLTNALKDVIYKDTKEENDEFIENVQTSLQRFYINLYNQIDSFYINYFMFMSSLYNILISKMNINKINTINLHTNYKYIDLTDYGYNYDLPNNNVETDRYIDEFNKEHDESFKQKINIIDKSTLAIKNEIEKENQKVYNNYKDALKKLTKQIVKENKASKNRLKNRHKNNEKSIKANNSNALKEYKRELKNLI